MGTVIKADYPTLSDDELSRLYNLANISDNCWEWKNKISERPQFNVKGRAYYASRLILIKTTGINDNTLYACHTCDNNLCVNPKHLFWGTQKDNMKDCSEKNRLNTWSSNKTYCKYGHEFSEDNTKYNGKQRICLACRANRLLKLREETIKRKNYVKV